MTPSNANPVPRRAPLVDSHGGVSRIWIDYLNNLSEGNVITQNVTADGQTIFAPRVSTDGAVLVYYVNPGAGDASVTWDANGDATGAGAFVNPPTIPESFDVAQLAVFFGNSADGKWYNEVVVSGAAVSGAQFVAGGGGGLVLQITGPSFSTISAQLNTTTDFQVVGGTPPTLTQIAVDLAKAYHFSTTNFTVGAGTFAVNTIAVNALIVGQALFAGTATFAAVAPGGNITTLSANVTATQTGITVASGAGISTGSFYLIDSELIQVTAGGGTTSLTILRGQLGSTAIPHSSGANIANYSYGGEVQIGGAGITIADNYHAPVNTLTLAAIGFTAANSTSGASFQCTALGCTVYGSGSTSGNYVTVSAGGVVAVAPPSNVTTLNGGITSGATSCVVVSGASVANGGYYLIDNEVIHVTAGGGTVNLTIQRAQFGSTAASHSNGANFQVFTAMALESGQLLMVGGGFNASLTNTELQLSGPGGEIDITSTAITMSNSSTTAQTTLTASQWNMALGSGLFGGASITVGSGSTSFQLNGGVSTAVFGVAVFNGSPQITLGPSANPTWMTIESLAILIKGQQIIGTRQTGPGAPAGFADAVAQSWCNSLYAALNAATGHGLIN